MKKLKLENPTYKTLLLSFAEWLDILGHTERSVYGMPIKLREFFHWLEGEGLHHLGNVEPRHINAYYQYLKTRPNERRGGALGNRYLNKHQTALRKLREYQIAHKVATPLRIHLKNEVTDMERRRNVLTQGQAKALFGATESDSHAWERLRLRDRALLTCLYSCGLRRNEAVQLDTGDILFERQRIHVRKGKNYKERYVPFNGHALRTLEDYLYGARPQFYNASGTDALLISTKGTRVRGVTVLNDVKRIARATGDREIIEKDISPHTLRHSIATHLLQRGVPIKNIKTFLGHESLVSTQIYTHLLKEMEHGGF